MVRYYSDTSNARIPGVITIPLIGLGLHLLYMFVGPFVESVANWGLDISLAFNNYYLLEVLLCLYAARSRKPIRRAPRLTIGFAYMLFSAMEFLQLANVETDHPFGFILNGTFDFPGDFIAYAVGIALAEYFIRRLLY